jgi:phosphoribosylformimino-5-aminoimidazole carboxamide ribotide isomerase
MAPMMNKPAEKPHFIVFPAIDLKGGQVVRLAEGDMNRATIYGDDPAAQAMLFAEQGSDFLHVVDLDGSFAGQSVNGAAVEGIVRAFPGHVQLGGGIRDAVAVERWFGLGVSRLVIGTAALKDPQFVKEMARAFPSGIVVAVDARDGFVATDGWAEKSNMAVVDLARRFEDVGVAALLFTDVGRDGLLKGVNIEATVDLARAVAIPVIASGGVAGLADIRMLSLHANDGVEGVITGRALYDGRLDLKAAIALACAG